MNTLSLKGPTEWWNLVESKQIVVTIRKKYTLSNFGTFSDLKIPQIKKEDREVCSSDGMLISKRDPWAGKKPGLRKRKEKIRSGCAKRK